MAAALVAPRRAFLAAARETGPSYRRIARWFACTESCAALRWGEVTGDALALVAPRSVRVRGEPFAWPPEPELRRLASGRRLPGIRRAKLQDDPRRTVLSVA